MVLVGFCMSNRIVVSLLPYLLDWAGGLPGPLFPLPKSNLLASTIGGEVTTGLYRGYVVWDFIPGRSYEGEQARYRQLMTELRPTLAEYGEVLVLQQDGCGLHSR